jgi:hypothetical protein
LSRWKYKTEKVTVGENSQTVRMMTAGDQAAFGALSKKIQAGAVDKNEISFLVVRLTSIDPTLTEEEARDMPPELLMACVSKAMELSGMKTEAPTTEGPGEKKVPSDS